MNMIERLIYKPAGGQFREWDGINAIIEPSDLSLYQQLIPKPFAMPEKPVVFVFCAHYLTVCNWPLTPYYEWAVSLRCNWDGVPGWYILSIPVTKQVARLGGRYLGFPKYIPNSITLAKGDHGWNAQSQYKGKLELSLEFQSGLTRQLSPLEDELMSDDSLFKKGDIYLFSTSWKRTTDNPRSSRTHCHAPLVCGAGYGVRTISITSSLVRLDNS